MLSPVFLPAIKLDEKTYGPIVSGDLPVRIGQWICDPYGRMGQYVTTANNAVVLSYTKGDSFEERTQRFVRAVKKYKNEAQINA